MKCNYPTMKLMIVTDTAALDAYETIVECCLSDPMCHDAQRKHHKTQGKLHEPKHNTRQHKPTALGTSDMSTNCRD